MVPDKPQYLMFSATIPHSIELMAEKILKNPVYLSIGQSGLPNSKVKQLVLWVADSSKKKKLFSIIEDGKHFLPPVVIFVESRIGADMLCEALTNVRLKTTVMENCFSIVSGFKPSGQMHVESHQNNIRATSRDIMLFF